MAMTGQDGDHHHARARWANLFVLFATALLPLPTAVVSHALQEA